MTRRAQVFLAANAVSPVVYCSVVECGVVYRLADDRLFNLTREDSEHVGAPRWAHLPGVRVLERAD